jgi:hypothetical protein
VSAVHGPLFDEPGPPYPNHLHYSHRHNLTMAGAKVNPNGTWSSLWTCSECPDVFVGGKVGPVPPGYCMCCGWVQRKKWPRKRCEECRAAMEAAS